MTVLKRNAGAFLLAAAMAVLLCLAVAPIAHADTGHYFYSFSKGQKSDCGPVKKTNTNTVATLSIRKSDDNVFTPVTSVLGVRVRFADGSAEASQYTKFSNYVAKGKIKYLSKKAKINTKYKLRGQVDSSSKKNLIQVWGYWTP